MMAWLIVFVTLVALDLAWAIYTKAVGGGSSPMVAAVWAVILYGLGASATIGWTKDPWLVVPACVGAFVGTYIGAWWNGRSKLAGEWAEFDAARERINKLIARLRTERNL